MCVGTQLTVWRLPRRCGPQLQRKNTLALERYPYTKENTMYEWVSMCAYGICQEPTFGERVLGKLTECRSLLMASLTAWVSTSSRAQHRFFTVCTTRSTVLYWVLWIRRRSRSLYRICTTNRLLFICSYHTHTVVKGISSWFLLLFSACQQSNLLFNSREREASVRGLPLTIGQTDNHLYWFFKNLTNV